jgi:hypothetical protein
LEESSGIESFGGVEIEFSFSPWVESDQTRTDVRMTNTFLMKHRDSFCNLFGNVLTHSFRDASYKVRQTLQTASIHVVCYNGQIAFRGVPEGLVDLQEVGALTLFEFPVLNSLFEFMSVLVGDLDLYDWVDGDRGNVKHFLMGDLEVKGVLVLVVPPYLESDHILQSEVKVFSLVFLLLQILMESRPCLPRYLFRVESIGLEEVVLGDRAYKELRRFYSRNGVLNANLFSPSRSLGVLVGNGIDVPNGLLRGQFRTSGRLEDEVGLDENRGFVSFKDFLWRSGQFPPGFLFYCSLRENILSDQGIPLVVNLLLELAFEIGRDFLCLEMGLVIILIGLVSPCCVACLVSDCSLSCMRETYRFFLCLPWFWRRDRLKKSSGRWWWMDTFALEFLCWGLPMSCLCF